MVQLFFLNDEGQNSIDEFIVSRNLKKFRAKAKAKTVAVARLSSLRKGFAA